MLRQFENNLIYIFSRQKYLCFPARTPEQKALKEAKIKSGWVDKFNDHIVIVENDRVASLQGTAVIPEWCEAVWIIEESENIKEVREKMYKYAKVYGTKHPLTVNIAQKLGELLAKEDRKKMLTGEQKKQVEENMGIANVIARKYHTKYRDKYSFEDLVGQAYLILCSCIKKYNPEKAKLSTFVYNQIYWYMNNYIRGDGYFPGNKYRRDRIKDCSSMASLEEMNEQDTGKRLTSFEKAIMHDVRIPDPLDDISFDKIMNKLTKLQRDVIVLHYKYGYTHTEIAKMWGVTRQSIYDTEKRAMERLRMKLRIA